MDKLFNSALDHARGILERGEQVHPVFHATCGKKNYIFMTLWGNEPEKIHTVNMLRFFFMAKGVDEYVFVSECWFTEVKDIKDSPEGTLEGKPGTKEGVFAIWVKRESPGVRTAKMKRFEIVRKKPLELVEDEAGYTKVEGTMATMITDKEPEEFDRMLSEQALKSMGIWEKLNKTGEV